MRILVLIHEFPPVGGGGGRVAEDLCSKLVKRGHEVKVLTTHIKGLPYKEERNGFHIVRFGSLRLEPYRASFLSMALTAKIQNGQCGNHFVLLCKANL